MKKITFSTKKKISLMLLSFVLCSISYAATFTATSSGKFSSTATWAGGVVPSTTVLVDQIIIQSGVSVTLDNDITINGAVSELNVEGTLTASNNSSVTITLGKLTGAGSIIVNALTINAYGTISFTGSLTANTLNSATGIQSSATITVSNSLKLSSGTMSLVSGGSLAISNNGTIIVSGGLLSVGSGGSVSLSGKYNVSYTDISSIAGAELNGSGLNNVSIDVTSTNTVTLTSNLVVGGTLSLVSGTLILASKDLTINGDIAASSNGTVATTLPSSIAIATKSSTSGSLNFSSTANTVKNLTVSVGNSGSASIGSNLNVNDNLQFNGGTLNIGGNALVMGASATITGASSSSYIITNTGAYIEMHLTAGASTSTHFPVGTTTHYAPAYIQLKSGTSGQVQVGMISGVWAQGTAGNNLSATQPLVDATWNIHSDISSNLNLDMKVMWSASMEVNNFNRGAAYISHYTNGKWDMNTTAAATAESGSMYSMTRVGLTSLSPFSVLDQNTNTSINRINNNITFTLFPNPTSENIIIQNNSTSVEPVNVAIYNNVGQLMGIYKVNGINSTISVADLVSGNYIVKFYNNNMNSTKSFVKM